MNLSPSKQRQLETIVKSIADSVDHVENESLINGNPGICLFLVHYGIHLKDEAYIEKGITILESSIAHFSDSEEPLGNLAYGFTGVAYVIHHLCKLQVLNITDTEFLDQIDSVAFQGIEVAGESKNYDLFDGLIGYGVYFLERDNAITKDAIEKILKYLLEISENTPEGIAWQNTRFQTTDYKEYNLGLAHGLPSILVFLSKVAVRYPELHGVKEVIQSSINWLQTKKQDFSTAGSHYSGIYYENNFEPRQSSISWCYGDIGIAIGLYNAFKATGDNLYLVESKRIVLDAQYRDISRTNVYQHKEENYCDTCFCHGTAGVAYLFNKLSRTYTSDTLAASAEFWLDITIDQYLKYRKSITNFLIPRENDNPIWITNQSLLEGASGVGLCLLSFLPGSDNSWEKLFLTDL